MKSVCSPWWTTICRWRASLPCTAFANTDLNGVRTPQSSSGLSGTGKNNSFHRPETSLWSVVMMSTAGRQRSIFNFEGGCCKSHQPEQRGSGAGYRPECNQTWRPALRTLLLDAEGKIDFNDKSATENILVSYPGSTTTGYYRSPGFLAPAAKNVIFLSADAFGVLPPICILFWHQRRLQYYFVRFNAKLAGTERGITGADSTFCMLRPGIPGARTQPNMPKSL